MGEESLDPLPFFISSDHHAIRSAGETEFVTEATTPCRQNATVKAMRPPRLPYTDQMRRENRAVDSTSKAHFP